MKRIKYLKPSKELIEQFIKFSYKINKDNSVDVFGSVDLSCCSLTKIPFKFNVVHGDFYCYNNQLTSLENSPKIVKGGFCCSGNNLTSLKHCPKTINDSFNCYNNQLTSLEHCPKIVNGSFSCSNNQLTSLEHCPKIVNGAFYCSGNKLDNKFTVDNYIKWFGLKPYKDGFIVFKKVSKDFKTQERTKNETIWLPKSTVKIGNWNPIRECGEGKFHACYCKEACNRFRDKTNDRYIAIKVKKEDMVWFNNPDYPQKISFKQGYVIKECK